MKTILKLTASFALLTIVAVSCSKLDVVGNDSARAFKDLLQSAPELLSEDEASGGWAIIAPDGGARFIWFKNSPLITAPPQNYSTSYSFNVFLEIDAAPFIKAGLDPLKLPANFVLESGKFLTGIKLDVENIHFEAPSAIPACREAAPLASYEQIVKLKRDIIGYHMQMDHYGISLGNGNMFEWAKNMTTNDKDIVFVLNPEPFIAASTDPANIEGWTFAKVTVDNANGKPVQVDKILKAFNLK